MPPVPATLDPAAADKAKDVVWGMSAYPHALRLSDLFTTMSEKAGAYDVVGLLDTCGEIESEAMLFGTGAPDTPLGDHATKAAAAFMTAGGLCADMELDSAVTYFTMGIDELKQANAILDTYNLGG